jgi:Zn finger protein HypA/HybF involved in hydrogenase expression
VETTELECLECGEVFEAVLGVADWEIECPACGSSDVDLAQ